MSATRAWRPLPGGGVTLDAQGEGLRGNPTVTLKRVEGGRLWLSVTGDVYGWQHRLTAEVSAEELAEGVAMAGGGEGT